MSIATAFALTAARRRERHRQPLAPPPGLGDPPLSSSASREAVPGRRWARHGAVDARQCVPRPRDRPPRGSDSPRSSPSDPRAAGAHASNPLGARARSGAVGRWRTRGLLVDRSLAAHRPARSGSRQPPRSRDAVAASGAGSCGRPPPGSPDCFRGPRPCGARGGVPLALGLLRPFGTLRSGRNERSRSLPWLARAILALARALPCSPIDGARGKPPWRAVGGGGRRVVRPRLFPASALRRPPAGPLRSRGGHLHRAPPSVQSIGRCSSSSATRWSGGSGFASAGVPRSGCSPRASSAAVHDVCATSRVRIADLR